MSIQPTPHQQDDYILMSTISDHVVVIDPEFDLDRDTPFSGMWTSHSLNREDKMHIYTITLLAFAYTASEQANVAISFSGDGGLTWPVTHNVQLSPTSSSRFSIHNLATMVTGEDIRCRFELPDSKPVLILKIRPRLIRRGAVRYG